MFPILFTATMISLAGAISPGPIMVVTLAKGMEDPRAGFKIALGHVLIDTPMILLIYFGLGEFFQDSLLQFALSILGGGVFIWMGFALFRARAHIVQSTTGLRYNAFTLGILTTVLNPMFLLWWATIGTLLITQIYSYGITGLVAFILAVEIPNLVVYSVASVLAYRSRPLWGPNLQRWLFMAFGVLLASFGVWFLVNGIQILT
jgi:threonine/homoserine/homoserine lactone efflux protein